MKLLTIGDHLNLQLISPLYKLRDRTEGPNPIILPLVSSKTTPTKKKKKILKLPRDCHPLVNSLVYQKTITTLKISGILGVV
jgi:hypothetical protein